MNKGLMELASRVEATNGPDRELDRAIMEALGLKPDYAADWGARDNCRPAPFAYTASIDAALTLVPEGWMLHCLGESKFMVGGPWLASLVQRGQDAPYNGPSATACSAPLALCCAALRAKAVTSDGGVE